MDCKLGANLFKVLSDETRLMIIEILKNGTKCACELLEKFKITQPTLSYHIKMLVDCELISCKKVGKWCHYTLNYELLEQLSYFIRKDKVGCNNGSK